MGMTERAQEIEAKFREGAVTAAVKKARRVPDEDPLEIDGVRCCLTCEEPIPEKRLEANPEAVRCVACQDKHEKGGHNV